MQPVHFSATLQTLRLLDEQRITREQKNRIQMDIAANCHLTIDPMGATLQEGVAKREVGRMRFADLNSSPPETFRPPAPAPSNGKRPHRMAEPKEIPFANLVDCAIDWASALRPNRSAATGAHRMAPIRAGGRGWNA